MLKTEIKGVSAGTLLAVLVHRRERRGVAGQRIHIGKGFKELGKGLNDARKNC